MRARGALPLLVLWSVLGCGEPAPQAPAHVDPATASRVLVMGTGQLCTTDVQCSAGVATPQRADARYRGACVLGTCFGLLTTESATVRAVLAERLSKAEPAVQVHARTRLLKVLSSPRSSPQTRLGAVIGLASVLDPHGPCEQACAALRDASKERDEHIAVAARLALARRADPTVLATLALDTREGTEHLRCSATRAMAPYLATGVADVGPAKEALPALVERLDDRAPGVRRAAAEVLAPWRARPLVRAALAGAAKRHPADLRYVVARSEAAQAGEAPR